MNIRDTIHNLQIVIDDLSHQSAETEISIRTNNHLYLTNIMKVEEKDGKIILIIDEVNLDDNQYDDDFYDGFPPPPCCID